jgi:hypothetical protein
MRGGLSQIWSLMFRRLIEWDAYKDIYITDIVLEDRRVIFEGFDESRTAELDMNRYRKLLITRTRHLAHYKAIGRIRPREESDEGEYIPSIIVSGLRCCPLPLTADSP